MQFIIDKFLNNTISSSELEDLKDWLQNPVNQEEFKCYLKDLNEIHTALHDIDVDRAYKTVLSKQSEKEKSVVKRLYTNFIKYAAVIVLMIGGMYFYQQNNLTTIEPVAIDIPEEKITLQLDNGEIKVLDENNIAKVTDAKGAVVGDKKGNEIIYNKEQVAETVLAYNTINVPYGKRFKIQLSDQTVVHLNAGSSLKYPVRFIADKERKVFLNGEAYFSVTKNENKPFIVDTGKVDIRVLGTKFEVSSYEDDDDVHAVLVEGAVDVYRNNTPYNDASAISLTPGYMATWYKEENTISVDKVDLNTYTAWLDGKVVLRRVLFKNIIKIIERHYNVMIDCTNKPLNNEYFSATFDGESIEEVMELFKKIIKYLIL